MTAGCRPEGTALHYTSNPSFGPPLIEAILLFAVWLFRSGIHTSVALGGLLFVDVIWALTSHLIHFPNQKSHAKRWSVINFVAIVLAVGVVYFPFERKTVVLMVIAIVRTVVDYWLCSKFYFPPDASVLPEPPASPAATRVRQLT